MQIGAGERWRGQLFTCAGCRSIRTTCQTSCGLASALCRSALAACRTTDGWRRDAMIVLYHCAAARSFRPLWTLEELGLPYDLRMLPFPPRVLAREYLALNPLGTIPLLLDGDTRMTESAAISQYLVARHGPTPLSVDVDEPDFGAFLNWLHFGEATLTFPQTLVLRYTQIEAEERRNPQVVAVTALRPPISLSATRCCWRRTSVSARILRPASRRIGSAFRGVTAFAAPVRRKISPGSSRRFPPAPAARP